MQPTNPSAPLGRWRTALRQLRTRLKAAWFRLPARRRSALAWLAMLLMILGFSVLLEEPRLVAPPATDFGPRPQGLGTVMEPDLEPGAPAAGHLAPVSGAGSPAAGDGTGDPAEAVPDLDDLVRPVAGEVLVPYGWREFAELGEWRLHAGLDYRTAAGAAVRAAAAGTVGDVMDDPVYGRTVIIDHGGGLSTRYAGLTAVQVVPGDRVSAGQVIAAVGAPGAGESALGPHLHFQVERNGDPVEPAPALR